MGQRRRVDDVVPRLQHRHHLANKHITETSFSFRSVSLGSLFGWIVSIVVNTGFTELKTHLTLHQWFLLVLPIGVCRLSLAFANIAYFISP